MGRLRTLTEILGGIAISGGFYKLGEVFGKSLHDLLAYHMPLKYFGNYEWFNYSEYVKMYKQYSNGLDNLFGYVFGITFGGLALASYVYVILKFREYKY